ncbi:prepilin-type N-terminal cleavage/methylation domain-containing protein [Gilliamella sp. wkB112]|uniref:prepilin-type N-terminal cleavage/methylation domain-containing protein n=1 Tax=Gilliamella sp. wkB112 TaxID=3120257 RepID=UPI00080E2625|nr:prepilin-type N-terminal cleavage/methylation domain-containing protein [Gilliamella apicola]OCG01270.1 hypothetical protein A9G12_01575 [Gilliamella apicola]
MNKKNINGFCLIEVMVAVVLLAIILVGFINYQQVLLNKYHYLSIKLSANQIAYQLLDSYPQINNQLLPPDWQYNIDSKSLDFHCKMVVVSIIPLQHKKIMQQRLFCN